MGLPHALRRQGIAPHGERGEQGTGARSRGVAFRRVCALLVLCDGLVDIRAVLFGKRYNAVVQYHSQSKGHAMPEMISVEQARDLVLSHVSQLPAETVPVLDAAGRVAAVDLKSDIDISPFAHAAMDGFAMRAAQLQSSSPESPVELDVIAEVAAGRVTAERAAVKKEAIVWKLSEREMRIVEKLGQ